MADDTIRPDDTPAPVADAPAVPDTLGDAERTPQPASPLEAEIIAALKTVYDPEIPVDIYELGLIYRIEVEPQPSEHGERTHVNVDMTLTAPGCPVAEVMPGWVQEAVQSVDGVDSVFVDMVWDPPWTPERMSMRAKLELNML